MIYITGANKDGSRAHAGGDGTAGMVVITEFIG